MDLYEVLAVRRNATAAEIRRAYQRRARQLHPALNPGDPVAAERFRVVSRAFEVLSDAQKRAAYDRGETHAAPAPSPPEGGFEGFDFSAEVRLQGVGFHEIFDARPSPGGDAPLQKGEDLEQKTRISFEEAMTGARRRVHLVRHDECPICRGEGEVAYGPVPCPGCQGSGQVRGSRGHMIFSRRCAECGGTGVLQRRPCRRCAGEGRVIASEWLDVQIPAGVANGSHVRLPGCGNAGRRGGAPGDFVLGVEVEPHPQFRREGEDLVSVVPVSMTEAALGAHVAVATPDGPVTIEVPAGTQHGQRFRLRKRGVPRLGDKGRGDLFAEVQLLVPAVTDDRSRELLREFERLNSCLPRKPASGKGA